MIENIACIPSVCKFACRRPAALLSTASPFRSGWLGAARRTQYPSAKRTTGTTAIKLVRTLYRGVEDSEKVLSRKHDATVHDSTAAAVINQEDLSELNAEIGGFVGALGDADFDLDDNALAPKQRDTPSPRTGRWTNDGGVPGEHKSPRSGGASRKNIGGSHCVEEPPRRRLTLADHPPGEREAGSLLDGRHSRDPNRLWRDAGHEEEYPIRSSPSSDIWSYETRTSDTADSPRRKVPDGRTCSASGNTDNGEHGHLSYGGYPGRVVDDNTLPFLGGGGNAARGEKSVLVLNGAACFIGGRLASTGESQKHVFESMERAAEQLGLSLTVCSSNREEDLLDRICSGKHDAIVYNPAGFSLPDAIRYDHRNSNTEVVSKPESPSPSIHEHRQKMHRVGIRYLQDRSALEYGLARAGCPVVTLLPVDLHGHRPCGSKVQVNSTDECQCVFPPGRLIAGFKGADSYSLAMAAVASLLEGEGRAVG